MERKNTGWKVLVCFLLIIILAMGGFILYDKVLKDKYFSKDKTKETNKKDDDKKEKDNNKKIETIEDYMKMIGASVINDSYKSHTILSLDNDYKKIDLKIEEKCMNDGDVVSFAQDGNTIEYVCNKNTKGLEDDYVYYDGIAKINDSFKYEFTTFVTCGSDQLYTNGEYYIIYNPSCSIGSSSFKLYDKNNNIISSASDLSVPSVLNSDNEDYEYTSPFIKDNTLYYVVPTSLPSDKERITCNIMSIDLNEEEPTETLNGSFACYYSDGR